MRLHTLQHLVEGQRVVADADARGAVDRVGDRRAGAADAELAEALALERVRLVVELGQEHRVHRRNVGVDRHVYSARSWLTKWPKRGSMTTSSVSAAPTP